MKTAKSEPCYPGEKPQEPLPNPHCDFGTVDAPAIVEAVAVLRHFQHSHNPDPVMAWTFRPKGSEKPNLMVVVTDHPKMVAGLMEFFDESEEAVRGHYWAWHGGEWHYGYFDGEDWLLEDGVICPQSSVKYFCRIPSPPDAPPAEPAKP